MFNRQEIFPDSSKPLHKALVALLALVAVSIPFKDKFLVNPFIVLTFIVWLFTNPLKNLFTKTKNTGSLLAIVAFYLLHVVALLYTHNMGEGLFSLEIKLSLLLFPLVFYTSTFTTKQCLFFLKSFIIGNLVCCMLCLFHALWFYITAHENLFFYESLSWFQHPSYLAMYITFCCVTLLLKNVFNKTISYLSIIFFTIFVLMLSSKTGLAIHFTMLLFCIISLSLKGKNYFKIIGITFLSLLIFGTCLFFIPEVNQRFKIFSMVLTAKDMDKASSESTTVRVLIWNEATQIIKEHPVLGVSPGDTNDALYTSYQQNGLTGAYAHKLNAHNQYFQTGVGLGLIGMASLLITLILPLFKKNKLLIFFIAIIAIDFLTESMLQTMAGCIFFGYFYAMLCFEKNEQQIILERVRD